MLATLNKGEIYDTKVQTHWKPLVLKTDLIHVGLGFA